VYSDEALGSVRELIREMRRREALRASRVWREKEHSAQSYSALPGGKNRKIG